MLTFAAVGVHGRELSAQLAMCAVLLFAVAAPPLAAQRVSPFNDLTPELASRIAASLPPASQVSLSVAVPEAADESEPIRAALVTILTAGGLRVVNAVDGIASINVSCAVNLRERVCLAAVRGAGIDVVATAIRARTPETSEAGRLPAALALSPLFSQQVQMLDVRPLGEDLLVLDRASITRYQRDDVVGWRAVESRPLPVRVWPRDLRGRVFLFYDNNFGIFLPGMMCTGRFNPLSIDCTQQNVQWPSFLIDNVTLEPGRNYFTTPEGLMFYGAAPSFDGKGWVVVDRRGALTVLDANRRPFADAGAADDVTFLRAPSCAQPEFYLAASHQPAGNDVLRAFAFEGTRLAPAAPDLPLPGTFTALWWIDRYSALVITRLPGAERYDAFQVRISCRS